MIWWTLFGIIAFIVVGPMILVAIGLPFKKSLGERKFANGVTIQNYDLPDKLKWLQNPIDGLTGDRRGDYWAGKYRPWILPLCLWKYDHIKMWWWSGWRNPWNYLKRIVIGINMTEYNVTNLAGQDYVRDDFNNTGFQILVAKRKDGTGWPRPMLYLVHRWGDRNEAIVIQIGWKISLKHNTTEWEKKHKYDRYKGITFEPNPWKDIS